jgi:transposase
MARAAGVKVTFTPPYMSWFKPIENAFSVHFVDKKQPRMVRTFLKVHTRPRLAYALRCRGY